MTRSDPNAPGVKLLFFASAADWAGHREFEVRCSSPRPILELARSLPALRSLLERRASLRVAVNCEYADFSTEVSDGDEVAFLPPVSGG